LENDLGFQYLKRKVISKGLNCTGYKEDFLRRRLEGRMRLRGVSSYLDYARYMDKNPSEFEQLLDALTINVSEFFRDSTVWSALQTKILPLILMKNRASSDKKLRVWSAACADGEEPYTIAIILREALSLGEKLNVEIMATDIDEDSLKRAREGTYSFERLRSVKQSVLRRYFTSPDNRKFRISDEIKQMVTFKQHDLSAPPPSHSFDIISCRNVMIYFSRDMQQRLLRSFYEALSPGGYLILGKVESPIGDASFLFKSADLIERIYQRPKEVLVSP